MNQININSAAALVAAIWLVSPCVATTPSSSEPDPVEFMGLLEEPSTPGTAPVEFEGTAANEPGPANRAAADGEQVQRILEESQLILRSIAADAGAQRDELQKASTQALAVIRNYIDRLPKDPAVTADGTDVPTPREKRPVQMIAHPGTRLDTKRDSDLPVSVTAMDPSAEPEALSRPSTLSNEAVAKARLKSAILKAAAQLRGLATAAETRASELEKLLDALEEYGNE